MSRNKLIPSVTAENVAELAGVSRWTVNRAFRQDGSISEKSRKKVLEAAEHLGYAPDLLAASLASSRSNLVSLLVDDFNNPYKLLMMEQLTRGLRAHGLTTLLINTTDSDDASVALLHASQRRVEAAVLIGSRFDDNLLNAAMGAKRLKKLIVFGRYSANQHTLSICCDDVSAMTQMTRYVHDQGYRKPLFIAGPQTPSAHLLRKETFLNHWRQLDNSEPGLLVVNVYDPQIAYSKVTEYLRSIDQQAWPDVLVCENDALAVGASDAVKHELKLTVPTDIAVTGFDDAPIASNPNYLLTTYRQPIAEMADVLGELLVSGESTGELTRFNGQLIARKSA